MPLIVAVVISAVISVSAIISEGDERIEDYRKQLLEDVKNNPKSQIDIAINSIKKIHEEGENEAASKQLSAPSTQLQEMRRDLTF